MPIVQRRELPLEPLVRLVGVGHPDPLERAAEMFGCTLDHLMQMLRWGVSAATADRYATLAGYHPVQVWGNDWLFGHDYRESELRLAVADRVVLGGERQKDVAAELGLCKTTVWNWVRAEYGADWRSHPAAEAHRARKAEEAAVAARARRVDRDRRRRGLLAAG